MSGNAVQPAARRRIEQSELDAICVRHDRLWQAKPGGARAVLAWLDLSGLSLRGRNLADADFAAANLIGADLSGAKLDNATFFGADMQDCLLVEASLRRTDLRGACLRGADLTGADLFEADLREGTIAAADAKLGFKIVEAKVRSDTQANGACLATAQSAVDEVDVILGSAPPVAANIALWDGHAGERIADAITRWLSTAASRGDEVEARDG